MFTGIIEEIGRMKRISSQGESMVLEVEAETVLTDVKLGDSIAVNGVCLTVTSYTSRSFKLDVTPQTFRHTNLRELTPGSPVNLERAMAAGGRFGGHIVQGHADGTGIIRTRSNEGNAVRYRIEPTDKELMRYIIPKGSITVDGISLTVAETDSACFSLSIIPHTLEVTALQYKHAGDTVNIEADILGKYVEHLLGFGNKDKDTGKAASRLSEAFLAEHGF